MRSLSDPSTQVGIDSDPGGRQQPSPGARSWKLGSPGPFAGIWIATALLFAISPIAVAGSLSSSAILSMLPFAAILAIAAIGQMLVVQQRGWDLSVPGVIALAAVIVTNYPGGDNGKIFIAVLLVLAMAVAIGALNGWAITQLGISPIICTLSVNALLLGGALVISDGSPTAAPTGLTDLALDKTLGIPHTVLAAIAVVALVGFVSGKTVVGRRFLLAGANPDAARAVGIAVRRYEFGTYVASALCYAAAGVLLAGFLQTPSIFPGETYLFTTVAAVVIAGTSLTGGRASAVAVAGAALFLSQLESLVLSTGSNIAVQYLIQGAAIGLGVGLRNVPWRRLRASLRALRADGSDPAPVGAAPTTDAAPAPSAALRLTSVSKRFPGVVALNDVSLEVRPGEVHAILGENGAGKSTLMSIAAGSQLADGGTLEIGGRVIDHPTPRAAQDAGLALVYQHPALLPDLTVAENMALGVVPEQRPPVRELHAWTDRLLAAMGTDVDPRVRVAELTVEERHLVEISKALASEPDVLILDEPTEPLDAEEIERLFAKVEELRAQGTAVVYISHRIPEVQRIADRITVLRNGRSQGTYLAAELSEPDILKLIIGRDLESAFPEKASDAGDHGHALDVSGLKNVPHFDDVSLTVAPGEIVGLGGVAGNGQNALIQALAGLRRARGTVRIGGTAVRLSSSKRAADAGIAYVPADRHEDGLFPDLTVRENMSVAALPRLSRRGVLSRRMECSAVDAQIDALSIRTPSRETPIMTLSGGNQQKALLARALMCNPKVLLAEEPTHGVDVGARHEIYRLLRDAARRGVAVLLVSSDAKELEGLCDRVLVFSRGRIVEEVAGDDVSEDLITRAAVMSTSLRSRLAGRKLRGFERFLVGDFFPSAIVIVAVLLLAAYTTSVNDRFILAGNLTGVLFLMSALAFVSLAQQLVLMVGGIDLSVGPLAGFLVVLASFVVNDGVGPGAVVAGLAMMVAVGAAVGLLNGGLVCFARMSAVVATLVTFTVLQGMSLLLRPDPGGTIDAGVATAIGTTVLGFVPIAFIVAAGVAIALEFALRWTPWGVALRAVGSREATAQALGVRSRAVQLSAFVGAGVLVSFAAILLMAQIGIGDPLAGTTYTLASVAAAVLGGASVFGGRGSFVGAFLGALLTQVALNSIIFLEVTDAWQYWFVGILTLLAAGTYSKVRAVLVAQRAGAG